ncbi:MULTISPECIES: helix-turn-helix domain-containing protein [Enterococcus]|uniref:HTH cro/C1-type domain-containing protein n=2 Tax=Enterococcus TaxID=1350 RepID=A0ABZ2SVZ3_9ENTE|nr:MULTISPECIES: helix-turn-helix transcriptional regulator [unclassified Enterococcus]MBO0489093.1 helix-turn-helix transcriptional regulator [Enterococcus sp. DIV1094]MBO1298496.1 helix-turn-helix transcriptional regulator [Enterococcus sp. DIV1271a]
MKNNFSRILGERLVKISEVHRATGLSRATLGEIYYQRAMNIQLDTLVKICDYLQIPLSELIEYVPKNKEGKRCRD